MYTIKKKIKKQNYTKQYEIIINSEIALVSLLCNSVNYIK